MEYLRMHERRLPQLQGQADNRPPRFACEKKNEKADARLIADVNEKLVRFFWNDEEIEKNTFSRKLFAP